LRFYVKAGKRSGRETRQFGGEVRGRGDSGTGKKGGFLKKDGEGPLSYEHDIPEKIWKKDNSTRERTKQRKK